MGPPMLISALASVELQDHDRHTLSSSSRKLPAVQTQLDIRDGHSVQPFNQAEGSLHVVVGRSDSATLFGHPEEVLTSLLGCQARPCLMATTTASSERNTTAGILHCSTLSCVSSLTLG